MNILILNWRDIKHPLAGGAEISLFEHAKYWKQKGNNVICFSSSFPGAKEKETIDGITIIRKGSHYTTHMWAFWFYITRKFPKVNIVIDSFHFIPYLSVLYIQKDKVICLLNEVAGKLWFSNIFTPVSHIGAYVEPYLIKLYRGNIFITGSDSAKKELISLGIPSKIITVVHHGFHLYPIDKRIKKESLPTLLYLGRVEKDKGIIDALEAFTLVSASIPEAQLWIAGKEEKKGITKKLIKTLDKELQSDVHYFGYIDEKKKFTLLKKSWLLVHPSYKEGWGLTVIEAASQSTPTVGYNVEGLQDSVQNGKTGLLVEHKNTTALANAIIQLLLDKTQYRIVASNALQWSKQFSWGKSVENSWKVVKGVYETNKKNNI